MYFSSSKAVLSGIVSSIWLNNSLALLSRPNNVESGVHFSFISSSNLKMREIDQQASHGTTHFNQLMPILKQMRAPGIIRLHAKTDCDDANPKPESVLEKLYGEGAAQYESVNRIFHDLCGERCLQGKHPEVIDQAMEQWLEKLECLDDEQSLPLFYVKCILARHDSLSKEAFEALFATVSLSEVAKFLLLDLAILFDATNILEWMLQEGVAKDATLHLMIQCQSAKSITIFMRHFSNVFNINGLYSDKNEPWSMAPLHFAVRTGNKEVVAALLNYEEINVDRLDDGGTTPLLIAVAGSDLENTKLLLSHGANPFCKNRSGESPIQCGIDLIAAKRLYDLETNTWKMGLDLEDPDSMLILEALMQELTNHRKAFLCQCTLEEIDGMVLRLMSSEKDQRHHLKKLKKIRDQLLDGQVDDVCQPLFCNIGEEAESIIAAGHIKNIRFGLDSMGLTFAGPTDQWVARYNRDDLKEVI